MNLRIVALALGLLGQALTAQTPPSYNLDPYHSLGSDPNTNQIIDHPTPDRTRPYTHLVESESQMISTQAKLVATAITSVVILTISLYFLHDAPTAAWVFYPIMLYATCLAGKFGVSIGFCLARNIV